MSFGQMNLQDLEDLVGRELDGRYRLDQYLDRGGYGAVYRGTDRKFEQVVAIKVGLSHREFMREAKLAAGVQHNHIVRIHDFGVDSGLAYLVMEYLEGLSLEKLFVDQGNSLSLDQIRKFVDEVGDALAHLHAVHLVHRDLKPRNIYLKHSTPGGVATAGGTTGGGKFVLLDFGIAAKLDSAGTQRNLTQDGAGTPEYMAPETLCASTPAASSLSDIYSFGVLLYQLVTGRLPFPRRDHSAQSFAECLYAIVNTDPPVFREIDPSRDYPPALESLILRCLNKVPSERPGSMIEVVTEFRSAVGEDWSAEPPSLRDTEEYSVVAETVPWNSGHRELPETHTTLHPSALPADTAIPAVGGDRRDQAHDRTEQAGPTRRIKPAAILALLALFLAFGGLIYLRSLPPATPVGEAVVASSTGPVPVPVPDRDSTLPPGPADPPATPPTVMPLPVPPVKVQPGEQATAPVKGSPAISEKPVAAAYPTESFDLVHLDEAGPIEFVRGQAGRFWMGSPPDEPDRSKNEQRVEVTLSNDFWIATTELTQRQWQAVKDQRVRGFVPPGNPARPAEEAPDLPVSNVSWYDAVAFCNELSLHCGLPPYYAIEHGAADSDGTGPAATDPVGSPVRVTIPRPKGPGFRLPTAAEWEYACRAGTSGPYAFGSSLRGPAGEKLASAGGDGPPVPVRSFSPNPWGLYDMHGNVGEWCYDAYQESLPGGVDPAAAAGDIREWRGGSSRSPDKFARSAARGITGLAAVKNEEIGFRLARNLIEDLSLIELVATQKPPAIRPAAQPPLKGEPSTPGTAAGNMSKAVPPKPPASEFKSKSTGLSLVLIPAGEFLMGSDPDAVRPVQAKAGLTEADLKDETPRHRVRITKPFYLGRYEVTQAEFRKAIGRDPSAFSREGRSSADVSGLTTDEFPVENVTWFDAIAFCNALSAADGLSPGYYNLNEIETDRWTDSIKAAKVTIRGGNGYRLPTEAEWEYACRAGTTTLYHVGDTLNGTSANIDGSSPTGPRKNEKFLRRPAPVNDPGYPVNPFALAHMHGNVREWCQDVYDKDAYRTRGPLTEDPAVPAGPAALQALRGGSWISTPKFSRSAYRSSAEPGQSSNRIGFRIARTP